MATTRRRSWTTADGRTRTAWFVDYTDNQDKRRRKQFKTAKEANAFRVKIENELANGTHRPDATRMTVADLAALYIEHCRGRMERGEQMVPKHFATTSGRIENYISHPEKGIGKVTLSALTTGAVRQWRDALRAGGATASTAHAVLATLSGMMAFGVEYDHLAANPVSGVTVSRSRDEDDERVTPPTPAELGRVLDATADRPDLRIRVLFAASTGLRASEQWALQWRHLDLDRGEVQVERRVDCYGNIGTTKSKAGRRTVPLSRALLLALKEHRLRSPWKAPDDLVFPNTVGRFQDHPGFLWRTWYPLLDRVGVGRVGWHALRHFAVSSWIAAGLDIHTVKVLAGHSNIAVTADTYGHLFPSERHNDVMDRVAAQITGGVGVGPAGGTAKAQSGKTGS